MKPSHGMKILRGDRKGGFSPQAEYIFRKQIEEADFVLLNRVDELSETEIGKLTQLVEANFPGMPCIRMSAVTGEGFDAFCDQLDKPCLNGKRLMDVDYDVYARGEAELGWLNAQVSLKANSPFELDSLLMKLLSEIHTSLNSQSAEIAHLKVIGMHEGKYAVANIVSSESAPALSIGSNSLTSEADVVVNARVAIDPEALTQTVQTCLLSLCDSLGIDVSVNTLQSFRPGRPVPTHRLTEA